MENLKFYVWLFFLKMRFLDNINDGLKVSVKLWIWLFMNDDFRFDEENKKWMQMMSFNFLTNKNYII